MTARRALALVLLGLAATLLAGGAVRADEEVKDIPPEPARPGPSELVHVPTAEMEVLLQADRRGIVLRYEEYARLLAAARARAEFLEAQPPVDGTLVAATGTLDLTGERAGRLDLRYEVEVLADGPRSVDFPLRNLALETLLVQDGDGTPSGRYEELDRRPRLRFDTPGPRTVTVTASAVFARKGEQRFLDLWLPPAAAMALSLIFPPGVEGAIWGEGAPVEVRARTDRPPSVSVRPGRNGRLRVAFAPTAKGAQEGPPILDTRTNSLHTVGDGLVQSRVIVNTDVLRTPVQQVRLAVPADFAVRSLEGKGVTGFRRDAAGGGIVADLETPFVGTVTLVLEGEQPYQPGRGVALPHVTVPDSVRHLAEMNVRFGRDVRVQAIRPEGGRRLPASHAPGQDDLLRYALVRDDASLLVDLEAGEVRLDAVSTYYLNLAESGKTLLATTTYRVLEGTVFTLRPRMPGGYELRTLSIDGKQDGFTRDLRSDGTLEIALARGVPAGAEISLAATLEQSQADWVPDGDPVQVPLAVPAAGATREEGLVGIGADAAFQVLEAALNDLVPVGAADLTARGIAAAGLVYGYRLDGTRPAVTFEVRRHEPRIEARVLTTLRPSPRRLDVLAVVSHDIRRAGVRQLLIDVPAWAGTEQVRFDSPFVRGASALVGERRPADVPTGYERWVVDLDQRVIGRHATVVRYHADQDVEDWRVDADRPLGVRVPLERTERFVVVQRAEGLEVRVDTRGQDLRTVELTDLPTEASLDPLQVLEILRLANGAEGVGLSVRKHGGAAVLDAIATQVHMHTAVAREGVLRTRAWIQLFNVERQFLAVELPAGSELVGAVVDGEPVKVLTDPGGVLLVPIPTARSRAQTTIAALTYETRLGHAIEGSVRLAGPIFHDLEVLQTVHRVAFDPDFEIERIGGDFGRVSAPARGTRKPWIVAAVEDLVPFKAVWSSVDAAPGAEARAPASGDSGDRGITAEPVIKDEELADHAETDNDLEYEESLGEDRMAVREAESVARAQDGRMRRLQEEAEKAATRAMDPARAPAQPPAPKPAAAVVPPGMRMPNDPAFPPPPAAPAPGAGAGDASRSDDRYHEGDLPAGLERSAGRRAGRRKGLLSLDVPVVMGPNVVVARRLGTGGALVIDLRTCEGVRDNAWLLGLCMVGVGLLAGAGGWRRKVLVLVGGLALLGLVAMLFGQVAEGLLVTLADALTVLAFLWALAWCVRRVLRFVPRRKAAAPLPAGGPTTAALLLGLAIALAAPARADEPRPPVPNVKPPERVFVPYDPADPTTVKPTDRVFLPLDTYLELFKAAHPESDPELVALGRMVTVIEAGYHLEVARAESAMASGEATYRFAKRGAGTLLVAWPLGGLAVTEATLDGAPVRLLLDKGIYRVAVTAEGDHTLHLRFNVPVLPQADGRTLSFDVHPFAGARLDLEVDAFDGDVRVSGAGRVEVTPGPRDCRATAWLGHARRVSVNLVERAPNELPATVRTRAESVVVHSLRDAGTESRLQATVYVLQGRAPFVDFALAPDVTVLEASGSNVVRWESLATPRPRVRLHFANPVSGAVKVGVRTFRAAAGGDRTEEVPDLGTLDTTGESGQVIVNAEDTARVEALAAENLFRIKRPAGKEFLGDDGQGRVVGAWRFATRPTRLTLRAERIAPRLDAESRVAVVFGDDRVRSILSTRVRIDERAPVGSLVFTLPGVDEVRAVTSAGLDTWWLDGVGDARRLELRYRDLRQGDLDVQVRLERRLGGLRDALPVPRMALVDARRDRGQLVLFTLPDVEQKLGSVAGLRSLPLAGLDLPQPGVDGARPVHAYAWDEPLPESLPVGLREPDLEQEAVVVSLVAPGDEEHRIEHLVLFDVRRGATDRLRLFVPDGGPDASWARSDVVTTRDLRDMRSERVTRTDADGVEVPGTLYDLRLQSARGGIIEVTVSQVWQARVTAEPDAAPRPVRVVRPEGVAGTHFFTLVRTFLDGDVRVSALSGRPETVAWVDLPFVPAGLTAEAILDRFVARAPFTLQVVAERHEPEQQAEAIVQAAVATVVVGMDGWARVRMDYRIFNRARQFLRLRLPDGALLFGATAAGAPIKPMAGKEETILLPVPKVPLGGRAYPVSLVYRARAGADITGGGSLELLLPEVLEGVAVDRTVVELYVPDGYDYDFDSSMTPTNRADVAADLAEVAVREARELLKVAEQGTLNQRWAASSNGVALVEYARQTLAQAPGANEKHRALRSQLDQIADQLQTRAAKVRQDLVAAQQQSLQAGPSVEEFASNARNIVDLDDVTKGLEDAAGGTPDDGVAGKNKAGWVFNPTAGGGKGEREELGQLKKGLEGKFRARGESERRKNVQTIAPDQSKQQQEAAQPDEHDATYDHKQIAWLNDNLVKEQRRNRQLGAVDTSLLNRLGGQQGPGQAGASEPAAQSFQTDLGGQVRFQDAEQTIRLNGVFLNPSNYGVQPQGGGGGAGGGYDLTSGADGFAGTRVNPGGVPFGTTAVPTLGDQPDAGVFFNDGRDGSFSARAENVFRFGLFHEDGDDSGHGRWSGETAAGRADAEGRAGLMGVDVDLPRLGQVFYFRALREGAAIRIDASKREISVAGRVAILLLVLAAAAVVARAIRRRRGDAPKAGPVPA